MRTVRGIGIALFFMLLATSVFSQTWKMTSLDWQPYSGSNMTNQGDSVQKLKDLLKTAGITLVVEFYPWERAQFLASTVDYVGYYPAWPEEVDTGFTASEAVDTSNIGLVVNTDSTVAWKDMETLVKNYKIGLVSTYVYPPDIEAAAKKYPANVSYVYDEAMLMRMLSGKRFDVGITDPSVTMYLALQENIKNVKVLVKSVMAKPLVVAFRSGDDNKARLDLLNTLLKKKK